MPTSGRFDADVRMLPYRRTPKAQCVLRPRCSKGKLEKPWPRVSGDLPVPDAQPSEFLG